MKQNKEISQVFSLNHFTFQLQLQLINLKEQNICPFAIPKQCHIISTMWVFNSIRCTVAGIRFMEECHLADQVGASSLQEQLFNPNPFLESSTFHFLPSLWHQYKSADKCIPVKDTTFWSNAAVQKASLEKMESLHFRLRPFVRLIVVGERKIIRNSTIHGK